MSQIKVMTLSIHTRKELVLGCWETLMMMMMRIMTLMVTNYFIRKALETCFVAGR